MKEVGLFSVVSFRIINCDFLQQLGQLSLPSLNVFRGCNNFISLFLTLQDKFGISARPINQSINQFCSHTRGMVAQLPELEAHV